MGRPVQVFGDPSGLYLVALIGLEDDRLWWPTWCVDGDEGETDGPRCLGNWLRFIPSDWRLAEGSLPDDVRRVAEWVASIEDIDQVGIRDGRGWIPRVRAGQPPRLGDRDFDP